MKIIYYFFSFLFGLAIGSFLNVLIFRVPRRLSIVKPNSFCPRCKRPIKWYENIPILSFVLLRGKCAGCQKSISVHYPLIELVTGCLFLYSFIKYCVGFEFFFYIFFFCTIIIIAGIDFEHQIIPDIFSMPGILIGFIFQILKGNFIPGLIGIIFGGGLILLIRVIGGWAYKKEVMGMGDVYLTAMIGAFVGFPFIIVSIFVAALIGSILGVVFVITTHQNRESPIPFGPFLGLGGIAVIIFEAQVYQIFYVLGIYL